MYRWNPNLSQRWSRSLQRRATASVGSQYSPTDDGRLLLAPHSVSIQTRRKSSSAFYAHAAIPGSVKKAVKTSFLNEAARDDSRLWKYDRHTAEDLNGVDVPISSLPDPLDDLYIQMPAQYLPQLPSGIMSAAEADPFDLAMPELNLLSKSIRSDLIGTDHPVLNKAASYFFDGSADGGKKVRPMMVLLLSRALADSVGSGAAASVDSPALDKSSDDILFSDPFSWQRADLPQAQRRLAEISEMIHTASLFHDDVIDEADTRRGVPAVHTVFGNKMAILAGDYLLARASICLARLRNVQVVETMSTIIEHLVRGEVMQMRGTEVSEGINERLVYYLRKNYYKTGSLMANSCKSAALLGDYPDELVSASYRFGKHTGMAFQLVDDVLDFEGSLSQLGKPSLSDLKAGLATAPVLFACEEFPELGLMVDRKFKEDGDVERAVELVFKSAGIERTKELARVHAERAMDAILELDASLHRDSLIHLANRVVERTK
jgi:geranylgeranyl pyrophosphate synthase